MLLRRVFRNAPNARIPNVIQTSLFGEVAERSIAAGCKPAAFVLRRFEPSPPHQPFIARCVAKGWRVASGKVDGEGPSCVCWKRDVSVVPKARMFRLKPMELAKGFEPPTG